MPQRSLVLIGFMASGKSTVGRHCARDLGIPFRDSDRLVQRRAGKSIADIFVQDGEAVFREMEADAIGTLAGSPPIVLATGGGAVMDPRNVAALRRTGYVVLLCVDPAEILKRTGTRASRPLLFDAQDPEARVRELLQKRDPAYRAAAHAVVDTTGLTLDETVAHVLEAYRAGTERRCRVVRPRSSM